jgi:hypothetical protein
MATVPARKRAAPAKPAAAAKKVAVASRKARKAPSAILAIDAVVDAKHQPRTRDKLVRDSFTMPRSDYELITSLKERALSFRRPTKKSELLRAGLRILSSLGQPELQKALDSLPLLQTGRPKKLPPPSKALGVE